MMKFSASSRATLTAVACVGLFTTFLADYSAAEPFLQTTQNNEETEINPSSEPQPLTETDLAVLGSLPELSPVKFKNAAFFESITQGFVATAYTLRGRTASGKFVAKGLIAADRRVLPLGSRVRLDAGSYSGEYTVADTGALVRGRKIDIWMPSNIEARRFGRRRIKLTVLSYGRRSPRQKVKTYLARN